MTSALKSPWAKLFDPPLLPPALVKPFKPFPEPWVEGPISEHLKEHSAAHLVALLTRLTADEAAALVAFGAFWLDDRPCLEPKFPLNAAQKFRLNTPAYGPNYFYEADPARIFFEDEDILIYHKEAGRPSQGVPYDAHNNVRSALERLLQKRGERGHLWLVHRLDADTSGLLMMAKNKEAARKLGLAFQHGQVAKKYLCLGLGKKPKEKDFATNAPITKEGGKFLVRPKGPGKESVTHFINLDFWPTKGADWGQALFLASPRTGRTHQIRLHLAWAGWPIVGDRFYGRPEGQAERLMLVSLGFEFTHPRRGEILSLFLAPNG